jgi:hypothetical protein
MGRRSRQRDAAGRPVPPGERPKRVRGEAAEALARADLEPLAPGEVPRALQVAAAVAFLIAVSNLVFFVADVEVRGEDPKPAGVIGFSLLMAVAGVFMLRRSYWAVLGFQALLALTCIVAGLSLLVASNWYAAILCVAILGGAGTLFWFLVRAMARIQMPTRPTRESR